MLPPSGGSSSLILEDFFGRIKTVLRPLLTMVRLQYPVERLCRCFPRPMLLILKLYFILRTLLVYLHSGYVRGTLATRQQSIGIITGSKPGFWQVFWASYRWDLQDSHLFLVIHIDALWRCAQQMQAVSEAALGKDTPVIHSPLHAFSFRMNTGVSLMSFPYRTVAVVPDSKTAQSYDYTHDWARVTYALEGSRWLGSTQKQARAFASLLAQAKRRRHNLVIFCDAVPQYSQSDGIVKMRTEATQIFGRDGRVFSGLYDITKKLKCGVVIYSLVIKPTRFWGLDQVELNISRIFQPEEGDALPTEMPKLIEQMMCQYPLDTINYIWRGLYSWSFVPTVLSD